MTISLWAILLKPSREQPAIGHAECLGKMAEGGGDTSLYPQKFFNIKVHLELIVRPIYLYTLEIPYRSALPSPPP